MQRWACVGGLSIALLVNGVGRHSRSSAPAVITGLTVNGVDFEYERVPGMSIQADAQDLRIRSDKAVIEVSGGELRVNGRSFGRVRPRDRISVVGGKVTVNGEERKTDV